MRRRINPAMIPDSGDTFPSHIGRSMKRRIARYTIAIATATANNATKPK